MHLRPCLGRFAWPERSTRPWLSAFFKRAQAINHLGFKGWRAPRDACSGVVGFRCDDSRSTGCTTTQKVVSGAAIGGGTGLLLGGPVGGLAWRPGRVALGVGRLTSRLAIHRPLRFPVFPPQIGASRARELLGLVPAPFGD